MLQLRNVLKKLFLIAALSNGVNHPTLLYFCTVYIHYMEQTGSIQRTTLTGPNNSDYPTLITSLTGSKDTDSYSPYWPKGHRILLPLLAQRTSTPTPQTGRKDTDSYFPYWPTGNRILLPKLAQRTPTPTPQKSYTITDAKLCIQLKFKQHRVNF